MNWLGSNWKMVTGSILIGGGGALTALGYKEIGELLISLGTAVLGIGVAHKAERAVKALESEAKK